jgi:hypothetical protein
LTSAISSWFVSARTGGISAGKAQFKRPARTNGTLDQLRDIAHQLLHVEAFRAEILPPREGQHPLGESRTALCPLQGVVDQAMQGGIIRHPAPQQSEAAHDRHQEIVEIMGDAPGELADRLKLLRLPERILRPCQLRRAFDDTGFERFIHSAQAFLVLPQHMLHLTPGRDVVEQHRHLPSGGVSGLEGIDVIPNVTHCLGMFLETVMPAIFGHFCIDIEPFLLVLRHHSPDGPSYSAREAGLPFKGGIGFQKDVIHGVSVRTVHHVDDAEAGVDRIEQRAVFFGAALEFLETRACLILPPAAAQGRLGKADEGCGVKRALQKIYVAEHVEKALRRRISFDPAALPGQQYEGKVRPLLLCVQPCCQRMKVGRVEALLREQGAPRPPRDSRLQIVHGAADSGQKASLAQHGIRKLRVATMRSQDQHPLGQMRDHGISSSSAGISPTNVGTPRSTP